MQFLFDNGHSNGAGRALLPVGHIAHGPGSRIEKAMYDEFDVLRQSANEASRLMKVLSNPDRILLLCQLA